MRTKSGPLSEVADILTAFGDVPCAVRIDEDGASEGQIRIVIEVDNSYTPTTIDILNMAQTETIGTIAELRFSLQELIDMRQVRAIADRYGIDPMALNHVIRKGKAR